MKAKVLRRPALAGLTLGIVVLCSVVTGSMTSAQTAPIDRSPWRMFITPSPHGPLASGHNDMSQVEPYFADASIPDESDPGWQPAPEPDTIGFDGQVDPNFGGEQASRLTTCGSTVDYTYFETIVTVPPGTTPNTFTVDFVDIDDAAQISIFNSANPTGTVGTDGIVRASNSGTQTGNLAGQLVEGPNRVVITQMDFCDPGNTLHEARITLDGSEVPTVDAPDATTTTDGVATTTTTTSTSARPPRTPIPPPASFGDVHIRTPDALVYDFQAVGDFVLAQTPSGDVMFQSRQDILDIRPRVSINTAAAMNVAGDTLEFYLDPEPRFFVNGVRTDLPSTDLALPLGGVVEASITQSAAGPRVTSPNDFTVTWPDRGTSARVLFKRGVHLDLGIAWLSGDQTYEGLLGNLDGDPANDMAVRDGDEISQPAGDEDLVSFGDSWRVPADDSLLQGETPVREAADDAQLTQDELDPEVVEAAEQTCRDAGISDEVALESCIFDVAATGDEGFVDSAATVEAAIEELPASAPEPVFATDQPDAREDDGLPWVLIVGVVAAVLVVVAGVAYSRATKAKRTRATGSSGRAGAESAAAAGPNAGTGPTDQSDPIDGG